MAQSDPSSATLFPGQGVSVSELAPAVEAALPELVASAHELVGGDPFARSEESTQFAQPAIYLASLAGYEQLGRPQTVLAGHSLGEITALVAAGALDPEAGLRLVAARGRLMAQAAESGEPGAMLAVGADRETAAAIAALHGLSVANENSPRQAVLSGPVENAAAAEAAARESGTRVKRLPVSGAFHSPAMEPAVARFGEILAEIEIRPPRLPVISSVTAEPIDGEAAELLVRSLVSPVRWVEVLEYLHELGVRRFLDAGPGRVVGKLAKQTLGSVEVEAADLLEAQRV